jgi:hypothetical protein
VLGVCDLFSVFLRLIVLFASFNRKDGSRVSCVHGQACRAGRKVRGYLYLSNFIEFLGKIVDFDVSVCCVPDLTRWLTT